MKTKFDSNPSPQTDNRLADFADQVLAEMAKQTESTADNDLRGLEEAILQLKRAFPTEPLDEAASKRMLFSLNARIRRESQPADLPFWKKWFTGGWQSQQTRQRTRLALAGLVMLIAAVLVIPVLNTAGQGLSGAAGLNEPILVGAIAVIILAGVFIWLGRRK